MVHGVPLTIGDDDVRRTFSSFGALQSIQKDVGVTDDIYLQSSEATRSGDDSSHRIAIGSAPSQPPSSDKSTTAHVHADTDTGGSGKVYTVTFFNSEDAKQAAIQMSAAPEQYWIESSMNQETKHRQRAPLRIDFAKQSEHEEKLSQQLFSLLINWKRAATSFGSSLTSTSKVSASSVSMMPISSLPTGVTPSSSSNLSSTVGSLSSSSSQHSSPAGSPHRTMFGRHSQTSSASSSLCSVPLAVANG